MQVYELDTAFQLLDALIWPQLRACSSLYNGGEPQPPVGGSSPLSIESPRFAQGGPVCMPSRMSSAVEKR